jgi:hypothetical protein
VGPDEVFPFPARLPPDNLFTPKSTIYDPTFKPAIAWRCLLTQGSVLAKVAVKVLNTLANSVPSERSFSATRHIHTKDRNRLSVVKADQQVFVYMNDRVLERLDAGDLLRKKRWGDLEEKDWVDLEDSYLDMFKNLHGQQTFLVGGGLIADPEYQWSGVIQQTGDLLALGTEIGSQNGL